MAAIREREREREKEAANSVRPDWAKIDQFGEISKVFGNFVNRVCLVSGTTLVFFRF